MPLSGGSDDGIVGNCCWYCCEVSRDDTGGPDIVFVEVVKTAVVVTAAEVVLVISGGVTGLAAADPELGMTGRALGVGG